MRTSSSHVIFSNVLFFLLRFLIPGIFGPPADRRSPSGLSFRPRVDLSLRWSRHTGQCYSSVSFLQFFLCTLLPLSLRLFFCIFHFFLTGTLNTILSTEIRIVARVCQLFFTSITGDRRREVSRDLSVANSCDYCVKLHRDVP